MTESRRFRAMYAPLRPVSLLAALLALASVAGCARDDRYELLSVEPLEVSRIDGGRAVTLAGAGFPIGREVEVLLRGVLHAPLGARRRVHHTLVGRTTTPERLELSITDADIAALGGRGTFVGTLEVIVHGASVDGLASRVVGLLDDVTVDVVPSERSGLALAPSAEEGLALASVLGLEIAPDGLAAVKDDGEAAPALDAPALDAPEEPRAGTLVAAIDPGGPAMQLGLPAAGLAPGSRIVAIDGMRVLEPSELRIDPRASRATITALGPDGVTRTLVVDLDAARGRPTDQTTRQEQLAAVIIVAALLFGAWPWSSRLAPRAEARPAADKPLAGVLTASISLALVLAASTCASGALSEHVVPGWLAVALFLRASASLASPGELPAGSPARSTATLLRREGVLSFVSALAATVAVGVFVLARGSAESASLPPLGGPFASAVWMPMSWALVRAPFGPFALLAILAAAGSTGAHVAGPRTRRDRLLRGLDDLGLASLASVFVRVTLADPGSMSLATRATALVATVALFLGLLRVRSAASGARWAPALASVLASVSAAFVAAVWLGWGPSWIDGVGEQAVAEVVLVSVGLVIVRIATTGRDPAPVPS